MVRDFPPAPPMLKSDTVSGFWLEQLNLRASKPFALGLLSASVIGIEALVLMSLSPLSGWRARADEAALVDKLPCPLCVPDKYWSVKPAIGSGVAIFRPIRLPYSRFGCVTANLDKVVSVNSVFALRASPCLPGKLNVFRF